ncbi:MAG TPA: OB-fold nucleic acid binding domain-containing protein, partial [Roseiflexaceae bacterium]|nr:OB-fold nucleic acid binding domain-containing protein [Roseiflexaceae bacterium]
NFVGMLSQIRRLTTKKGDSMLVAMLEDLEASIELVAFPKSYEKFRELLQEDALLRVSAKVDKSRRDDSLQLMLEQAAVLELAAVSTAADKAPELPPQMDLEGKGDDIPPELSVGVMSAPMDDVPHPAEMAGGHSADMSMDMMNREAAVAAAPFAPQPLVSNETPVDSQMVSIIRPRVKVGANGNGNGNGSGQGYTLAPPPEPTSSHALRLFLPRTDDFDADVRLMQTIDRVLRQSSGEDAVYIHMPNAVGTVLLKPRHKVRCDELLIGALRDVLGNESVVMEE